MRYSCLADTVADLQERGFVFDFSLLDNRLFCPQHKIYLSAGEFDVCSMYYFPKSSQSGFEKMIYGIEASLYSIKGILLITGSENGHVFPDMVYKKLEEDAFRRRPAMYNGIL